MVLGSRLFDGPSAALASGMPFGGTTLGLGFKSQFSKLRHRVSGGHSAVVTNQSRFSLNSGNAFVFDTSIISGVSAGNFRWRRVSVPTRYFAEASSSDFRRSVVAGWCQSPQRRPAVSLFSSDTAPIIPDPFNGSRG